MLHPWNNNIEYNLDNIHTWTYLKTNTLILISHSYELWDTFVQNFISSAISSTTWTEATDNTTWLPFANCIHHRYLKASSSRWFLIPFNRVTTKTKQATNHFLVD
jgi:hypothetical protein